MLSLLTSVTNTLILSPTINVSPGICSLSGRTASLEIPILKEFYAKYKDAGFELIGYSIDQDVAKLKSFVVENEIPWPMISQTESVAAGFEHLHDYYAINGVPELILIGRDGKVVMTDARGPKLAAALAELFPEIEPLELAPNAFSTERVSAPSDDQR